MNMIKDAEYLERFGKVSSTDIYIVQALSNDVSRLEIASSLGIHKRTLDTRIDGIRKKVDVDSVPALVALFFRQNLIE